MIFSNRTEPRSTIDRTGGMSFYDPHDQSTVIRKLNLYSKLLRFNFLQDPMYASGSNVVGGGGTPQHTPQHTPRTINQQNSSITSPDHYKHLTEELNKCFDDIELFVRYLESLIEYTKELERDHRRKDKKSTGLF